MLVNAMEIRREKNMWAEEITENKADFARMRHRSQWRRWNTVEAKGFSLIFLSFSQTKNKQEHS